MKTRRPGFFALVSLICLFLCIAFGVAWFASRRITIAAVPSTHDFQLQLARRLPVINFQSTTLKDALDFLRDVSGQTMWVDWAAMEAGGIHQDTIISQNLTNVSVGEVLVAVLTAAGPGTRFTVDERGTQISMKGAPLLHPPPRDPNAPMHPIAAFELGAPGNVPLPPSPKPIGERVMGKSRYTLVMDRGVLRLWITPVNPAEVYQQGVAIGKGMIDRTFEFLGILIVDRSSPLNSWEITVPLWMLMVITAVCPAIWITSKVRRSRRHEQQCIHCGYDLRATPQRCPECGRESEGASAKADPTALQA